MESQFEAQKPQTNLLNKKSSPSFDSIWLRSCCPIPVMCIGLIFLIIRLLGVDVHLQLCAILCFFSIPGLLIIYVLWEPLFVLKNVSLGNRICRIMGITWVIFVIEAAVGIAVISAGKSILILKWVMVICASLLFFVPILACGSAIISKRGFKCC
jgi:hypothetical protein